MNFRIPDFNEVINALLAEIRFNINKNEENVLNCVKRLQPEFVRYYQQDESENYTGKSAIIRGLEVYSEFLQDMVYYYLHFPRDNYTPGHGRLLPYLLNHPHFFYKNASTNKLVVWVDPKEQVNALHPVCRTGDLANFELFMQIAEDRFGGFERVEFLRYFLQKDKESYTILNSAARAGRTQIVIRLLDVAVKVCRGYQSAFYRALLSVPTINGYSVLMNAVHFGDINMVSALIEAGKKTYAGKPDEYYNFINQKNRNGYTARDIAAEDQKKEIMELLSECPVLESGPKLPTETPVSSVQSTFFELGKAILQTKRKLQEVQQTAPVAMKKALACSADVFFIPANPKLAFQPGVAKATGSDKSNPVVLD